MSKELSGPERETHLSMAADDRSVWIVFSDDPVMMRRLDVIAEVVRDVGAGKEYRLRADQVLLRLVRKPPSDERKAQLAANMRRVRKDQ